VKVAAAELGLAVESPSSLRGEECAARIASLRPDVICVAAYGLILPPSVLDIAPLGAVNVHASLLPAWRGAAPIQRAILAGDTEAGVSIMRMEEGLDTGPYCLQVSTPTADKNAVELTTELGEMGAEALVRTLPSIAGGTAVWIEQDESLATYADKVTKDDIAPAPALSALENSRRVRAALPAAPARVLLGGKGVSLTWVQPQEGQLEPGAVVAAADALLLGTASGVLWVGRLKPDGKSEMAACDWVRGARLSEDSTWASAR
jgi:methionyl-tRNA formyltransferase